MCVSVCVCVCVCVYVYVCALAHLLEDEHGVVEQLLQLLVGVVDAQLLKGIELKGADRNLR